jgi:hypothetical protein
MPSDTPSPSANPVEQRLIRSSPILWIFAAVLCGLLSTLGTQALSDLAELIRAPDAVAMHAALLGEVEAERQRLDALVNPRQVQIERADADLRTYEQTLSSAEENFRTWLQTRATLGKSGTEDETIRARRDALERLRHERDQQASALAKLRADPDPLAQQRQELVQRTEQAQQQYDDALAAATRVWTFKVLAARLALVLPLGLLGAWLWRTKRKSPYVTLLWGYWAFCIWMLFWGVEPYLPHYGGYAPLLVGIGVVVWASVSLVRWLNGRAGARRQRIVEKAIDRHRCPGCDRGYLVGREVGLDVGLARKATARHYDTAALRPRACPFCGLRLFGACAACDHQQPMNLDHCAACDAPWLEKGTVAAASSA